MRKKGRLSKGFSQVLLNDRGPIEVFSADAIHPVINVKEPVEYYAESLGGPLKSWSLNTAVRLIF